MTLKEKAKLLETKGMVQNFFSDLSPYFRGPIKALFKKYASLQLGLGSFEQIRFEERAYLENTFDLYLFERNLRCQEPIPLSLLGEKEKIWIQAHVYLLNYYALHQPHLISKKQYLDFYDDLLGSKKESYNSIFNEGLMPTVIEAMDRIAIPSLVIIFSQNLNGHPILFSADTRKKITLSETLLYSPTSVNKYHLSKEATHSEQNAIESQKTKSKLTA